MLQMGIQSSERLTEANFLLYAMRHYDNPHCLSVEEFYDDLKRIKYIKRLLNKYFVTGQLKERLILNHIIVLCNVFGIEAATKILFFKLEPKFWPPLSTFLTYLNCMPDRIPGLFESDILASNISLDINIIKILRDI